MQLGNLTAKDLALCTGAKEEVAEIWLPYFKAVLPGFGIFTKLRVAAFLAQVGHESAGLSALQENLNYSADGLANTWPGRYAKKLQNGSYAKNSVGRYLPSQLALKLHRKPFDIANNCYANRMGNSDEASGDGWKYRGRGLKQLTGKDNYGMLSKETGVDFVSQPDLLLQPVYALISACVFWKKNNLTTFADKGDLEGMTKKINGGLIGYSQRQALYKKALTILKD
jgi:putative chitinase